MKIEGMNCEHCASSVKRALSESPGVSELVVDLSAGRAIVKGVGYDPALLKAAVEALGYKVLD